VTRAAVWKAVRSLRARGLDVHAVAGKGYRLARPVEWLDRERLVEALPDETRARIERFELLRAAGSTNSELLAGPPPAPGRARVCVAEFQTSGRGRRGRSWRSPPGAGLSFSVAWRFELPPQRLSSLSLAAGVALAESLSASRCGLGLKWPNDLVWQGGKVGGILTELTGETEGATTAVVGVGINYRLPARWSPEAMPAGGLEPADLHAALGSGLPGRNALAASLVAGLIDGFVRFESEGFLPFARIWQTLDVLQGRQVTVSTRSLQTAGIARGIDLSGALLLEGMDGLVRVYTGDVSARPSS
jgi:BirA family biotin operon repressor/biotin-[acetyl-CoA-carboxylase] ligase